MARNHSEEAWMQPAAEMIVREGATLREAAGKLNVPLDSVALSNVSRSKIFQRVLRQERNRFHLELANDPERSRQVAIGQLLVCIERLMEDGEYNAAAENILKLFKAEGWLQPEGSVNVFAGLTQRELDTIRQQLQNQPNLSRLGTPPA